MSLDLPSGAGNEGTSPVAFGATRTLSSNDGADTRALALEVFSGTVLEQFYNSSVFFDRQNQFISTKVLDGGHVAKWPIIGDDLDLYNSLDSDVSDNGTDYENAADVGPEGGIKGGYHTPGDFITGRKVKMSERTIRCDDVLVAPIDIPFSDLDLSHFDVLTPYAQKLARSLAQDLDRKIATVAYAAATTAGIAGIYPDGNEVTREVVAGTTPALFYPNSTDGSANFRSDAADLAQAMDEDNVPEEGRFLFISPFIRKILRHEASIFDRDYNNASVVGSMNDRAIGLLEGFQLVVTRNLPGEWTGTTSGRYNLIDTNMAKYDFDCDLGSVGDERPAAVALCGASSGTAAVGMVQAAGMRTVIEDDERREVKFCKARMHVGLGVLAPWCAGVINMKRITS
jgi:hypothetical protein